MKAKKLKRVIKDLEGRIVVPSRCRECKKEFYIFQPGEGIVQGPKTIIICNECRRKGVAS